MRDHRGLIAGATWANTFLVIEGRLHAPIADCFLNQKTRLAVIDIAVKNNVD
jgi:branched-chain amino acid aminotransferase